MVCPGPALALCAACIVLLCICPRFLCFKCVPCRAFSLSPWHSSLSLDLRKRRKESSYTKSHSSIIAICFTKEEGGRGKGGGECWWEVSEEREVKVEGGQKCSAGRLANGKCHDRYLRGSANENRLLKEKLQYGCISISGEARDSHVIYLVCTFCTHYVSRSSLRPEWTEIVSTVGEHRLHLPKDCFSTSHVVKTLCWFPVSLCLCPWCLLCHGAPHVPPRPAGR